MTRWCVFCPLMVFLVATQLTQLWSHSDIRCSAGEFLLGDICAPCEPGTFMPEDNHQHRSCINCNQPRPGSPEVVLKECTQISDTKIGCTHGYYRMERGLSHQWVCVKQVDPSPIHGSETQTLENSDDTQPDVVSDTFIDDQPMCRAVTTQVEHGGEISIQCHRGHYLVMYDTGIPSCVPCGEGTFMPDDLHSFQTCRKCTHLEPGSHEVVVSCTSTRDTTLACEKGHYRILQDSEQDTACLPCSICGPQQPFEKQPCGTHSDTVCCHKENMHVVQDATGAYNCEPNPEPARIRTGMCPAGTYLDYDRGLAKCVPCGRGSFMPVDNHVNMNCRKCSQAREHLHEVEMAACTAVSDTVIICQEGYFLNNQGDDLAVDSAEDRSQNSGCQVCTVCNESQINKYVGRACSHNANTVCCPEPDMTVMLDDSGTVQCLAATTSSEVIIRCSKGYFLKLNPSGRPSCEQCPKLTFVDMENHSLHQCKPCSKADEFNMEIEDEQCSKTSDTRILCAEGHYRLKSRHDPFTFSEECIPCRNCRYEPRDKYPARKCQNYTDTICCPENNMDVEEFQNGSYICIFSVDNANIRGNISLHEIDQKRDGSCISGEYPLFRIINTTEVICRSCSLESNTTRNARVFDFCWNDSESGIASLKSGQIPTAVPRDGKCRIGEYMYILQRSPYIKADILCSWCEDGSFVAEDYHNRTECVPCSEKPGTAVIRNCTRTSDTKFSNHSDGSIPGNEHPLTTAIFFFVGAVLSSINGIRILFLHLSRAIL